MASTITSHPARRFAAAAAAVVVVAWAGWTQVDTIVRDAWNPKMPPADVAAQMWRAAEQKYQPVRSRFAPGQVLGYFPQQSAGNIQHTKQWTVAQLFSAPVVLDVAGEHDISLADFDSPEELQALLAKGQWELVASTPAGLAVLKRKKPGSQESP